MVVGSVRTAGLWVCRLSLLIYALIRGRKVGGARALAGIGDIEQIGSTHNGSEPEVLKVIARQRLAAVQCAQGLAALGGPRPRGHRSRW